MVDTAGLSLAVQVQSSSVQDPVGAGSVLAEAKGRAPNLQLVWGDGRYKGKHQKVWGNPNPAIG